MARIETVVTLDKKEIDDAIIELAKSQLSQCIGGAHLEYEYADKGDLTAVTDTFTGKVKA